MKMLLLINLISIFLLSGHATSNKVNPAEDTTSETRQALGRIKNILSAQDISLERSKECVASDTRENCSNLDYTSYDLIFDKDRHRKDVDDILQELDRIQSNTNELQAQGAVTTLRQVLFIHRHGDRTPIQFSPKDNLANETFWSFHGYGQLTNRGKARLYLLGKLMRARYGQFLGNSVNKNHRISRSSGSLRCIESAQVFMSSFLGLDSKDSPDARNLVWDGSSNVLAQLWQPVSVQSVPANIDGMLAESASCNQLMKEYDEVIEKTEAVQRLYKDYAYEKAILEEIYDFKLDRFYKWFWGSSLIEIEKSYFERRMNPKIIEIYDRMVKASKIALGAYQMTLTSKRLRSGLLMNDMVENMKVYRAENSQNAMIDGSAKAKKFVHYAAHDMTLIVLLGMLDQWDNFPFQPDYASNIAIELHQDPDDRVWFVRVFYMPRVPEIPTELKLTQCVSGESKGRCTLDKFESFVKPYLINNWQDWMSECRNDLKKINPYTISQ